jgi:hypothetical protein
MGAVDNHDDVEKPGKLRSWLRAASACIGSGADQQYRAWPIVAGYVPATSIAAEPAISAHVNATRNGCDADRESAVVLNFPIYGEALLVRLAERLRSRVAERDAARDPLLLTISRCPGSRLEIDSDAFVEFHADCSTYQLVIAASPDATVTVETTDFDTVMQFVAQYVMERLAAPATLEAAS